MSSSDDDEHSFDIRDVPLSVFVKLNDDNRNLRPSRCTTEEWVYAYNRTAAIDRRTGMKSGKWMIFRRTNEIDIVWGVIKAAVINGELGPAAKVSTKMNIKEGGHGSHHDPDKHVICVYTYDHNDEPDVMRVRDKLRQLKFTEKISYKTDDATRAGVYVSNGYKRTSKYRC